MGGRVGRREGMEGREGGRREGTKGGREAGMTDGTTSRKR